MVPHIWTCFPIKGWFLGDVTNMNGGLQYISIWVMVRGIIPEWRISQLAIFTLVNYYIYI